MNELTVLRDDVEWSTRLDGEINGVEINGKRINDVHDLTERVVKMTKTIHYLAWIATALAVIAVTSVVIFCKWLLSHESSIERLLLTSSKDFDKNVLHAEAWRSHERHRAYVHLREFHGLHWNEGKQDWVSAAESKKGNHRYINRGSR